jgi:hypothetical protein
MILEKSAVEAIRYYRQSYEEMARQQNGDFADGRISAQQRVTNFDPEG